MISYELAKSIYEKLNGSISIPVFSSPASATGYPYSVVGGVSLEPFDTVTDSGFIGIISIIFYDTSASNKKILQAMDEVYTLLHRQPLNVIGYNVLDVYFDSAPAVDISSDGKTREGIILFKFLADEV